MELTLPIIVVNFKTYENAVGEKALELAKIHEKVAKEMNVSLAIAVNPLDLRMIANAVDIPVFVQHCDPVSYGSFTGWIPPEEVKSAGAYGTLLNHAEHVLDEELLARTINMAKDAGLYTIVCADTPERGEEIAKFDPHLIAVEPPALIGGDISVTKADPQIVAHAVALIGAGKTLVGAGVKTGEDVKISIELGACGVLLASGVTRSPNPYETLKELCSALV